MPRFLEFPDAPLDPALVVFAQLGLADLKGFARSDPELTNLFGHYRRHVHHPVVIERVHDLFAIASFDAFPVVPLQSEFDWGIGTESQYSVRHSFSPSL